MGTWLEGICEDCVKNERVTREYFQIFYTIIFISKNVNAYLSINIVLVVMKLFLPILWQIKNRKYKEEVMTLWFSLKDIQYENKIALTFSNFLLWLSTPKILMVLEQMI